MEILLVYAPILWIVVFVISAAVNILVIRESRKLVRAIKRLAQVYFPQEHLAKLVDEDVDTSRPATHVEIVKQWDEDKPGSN